MSNPHPKPPKPKENHPWRHSVGIDPKDGKPKGLKKILRQQERDEAHCEPFGHTPDRRRSEALPNLDQIENPDPYGD